MVGRLNALSPLPVTDKIGGDRNLGDGMAENESWDDMFGLLSPKTSLNLCYTL